MRRLAAVAQLTAYTAFIAAAIIALNATRIPTNGEPVAIAVNGIRLAAIMACWYLLATTVLGAAARAARATTATAILDRCSLAFTRQVLTVALATATVTATVTASPVAAAAGVPPPGPAAAANAPVMHLLTAPATGAAKPGPPTDSAPAPPPPAAAPRTPQLRDELTLQVGDHLWGVAERTLASVWRHQPAAHDVVPYWHTLIEANRSRLADPSNPDLVYPGQVIVLPPPPAAPTASAGP